MTCPPVGGPLPGGRRGAARGRASPAILAPRAAGRSLPPPPGGARASRCGPGSGAPCGPRARPAGRGWSRQASGVLLSGDPYVPPGVHGSHLKKKPAKATKTLARGNRPHPESPIGPQSNALTPAALGLDLPIPSQETASAGAPGGLRQRWLLKSKRGLVCWKVKARPQNTREAVDRTWKRREAEGLQRSGPRSHQARSRPPQQAAPATRPESNHPFLCARC